VSITVPTAQERSGSTPPRPPDGRRIVRIGALLAAVVVAMLAWGDGGAPRSPTTAEAVGPALSAGEPNSGDSSHIDSSIALHETFFPGPGAVTGVASSIHGMAVVGQRQLPGGDSFVWTRSSGSADWVSVALEGGPSAVVRDVVAYVDGFVVAGAIVEPGSGTSVPTLWFGTAGSGFTIRDRPFPGPGRIDRIHVLGGELVVVGQAAGPFTDNIEPGSPRFGRLLSGSMGDWTDLTPSGSSVVVSDVVEFDGGLLAVGADSRGPVAWWRSQPEDSQPEDSQPGEGQLVESWTMTRVTHDERAVAVDVVSHPEGGFAALVRTWADRNTPHSTVFRAEHPDEWHQVGLPLRRALGWIEPTDGGLVGGVHDSVGPTEDSPLLWRLDPSEDWSYVEVARHHETVGTTELRGAMHKLVYGSSAGQPVVWSTPGVADEWSIVAPESNDTWLRVGPLPAGSWDVLDDGRHVIALARGPSPVRMWISSDGTGSVGVELDTDFALGGVGPTESGVLVWGQHGTDAVIYDVSGADGSRWATRTLRDATVRHVSDSRYGRHVLAETASGSVRIEIGDRGNHDVTPVPALPPRIVEHAGVLVGYDHTRPIGTLTVSADRGDSWHTVEVSGFTLATSEAGLLVVSGDSRMWVVALDTFEVSEVAVPAAVDLDSTPRLGAILPGWAGGLLVDGPAHLTVDADLDPIVVAATAAPETGMLGVFLRPVPGPRGYVVASEGGQPVLYQWTGGTR
jgi:hypothetical protein